jgi:hypothetical protein
MAADATKSVWTLKDLLLEQQVYKPFLSAVIEKAAALGILSIWSIP